MLRGVGATGRAANALGSERRLGRNSLGRNQKTNSGNKTEGSVKYRGEREGKAKSYVAC